MQSKQSRKPIRRRKNGNWSSVALTRVIRVVDDGHKISTTTNSWDIPITTLRNHVTYKKSFTRQRGRLGILTSKN